MHTYDVDGELHRRQALRARNEAIRACLFGAGFCAAALVVAFAIIGAW